MEKAEGISGDDGEEICRTRFRVSGKLPQQVGVSG